MPDLLTAVIGSAMVTIVMRISEKYVHSNMVVFCANYAACMTISTACDADGKRA